MPPEQFVPGWILDLLTDAALAAMAEELIAIMSEFHPAGAWVLAQSFAEADLRDVLPHITVPTLLLYGAAESVPRCQ
jgi:pimeloyl-ACP methyl ester carboxylesterase